MGFEIGTKVELVGLNNQSYNGKNGIIKTFVKETGRYGVYILDPSKHTDPYLSDPSKLIAVKESNLVKIQEPSKYDPMDALRKVSPSAWQVGYGLSTATVCASTMNMFI